MVSAGDALGGVDGGGVAETGRGLDVVGWQPDGVVAAGVSDGQVAAATYSSEDPPVHRRLDSWFPTLTGVSRLVVSA